MKEFLVDISVLLIFFTRHEQFRQVFAQVKKARPSELFLYQDGPRADHPEDEENIKKCREIAENIDWDCKVHRLYQEKNIGVDPSGYLADRWAFSQAEKCIVLEDDVVPSLSFFSFCKKMLDKYENDERVMLISGMNVEEQTKGIDTDYFFSSMTITWGWASWGRVVRNWDKEYKFLDNKEQRKEIQKYISEKKLIKNMISICLNHRNSGVAHFETILIGYQYSRQGLTIVPQRNMINNIGIVEGATHYDADINMIPRGLRRIFTMSRYELDTENMKEPEKLLDYVPYKKAVYHIYAWRCPVKKIYRLIEVSFYRIKKGDIEGMKRDIRNKLRKFISKTSS